MTEQTNNRHHVPCPHPGCEATLKVPATLPAGEYKCLCHSCTIRLVWATTVKFQRTPYVELVKKKEVGE